MFQISIVEYDSIYAQAIAEMWNNSSDGWNGRVFNSTEEKVLQQESGTKYLNLYLAVESEKVVGYVKLTRYPEEKGVAYIEMLSVLPSYQGKGIGRELVQKCILRAAELGYERIDLFTWPANLKAVPLYKKCGFFWERMDSQATHLMNFLPGLLNNDLLKPYWNNFDWYKNLIRELKIEPDGRTENGFDFYDYLWEKEGKRIEVTFERFGRGIVSLKTPDFSFKVEVPNAKPVFGLNYPIHYTLENYQETPLSISLQGENDALVDYNYQQEIELSDKRELDSTFYLKPLLREISEWETSPTVNTRFNIEGKEITFKTGLKIQFPLMAELRAVDSVFLPNRNYKMYLNVHNHFAVTCSYHLKFPVDERLQLSQSSFDITLNADERSFIELDFCLTKGIIYNPCLQITAKPVGDKEMQFTTSCHYCFQMLGSKDGIDSSELLQLMNGNNCLYISKIGQRNFATLTNISTSYIQFITPEPGKPYSEELESELPYETIIEQTENAIQAILKFRPPDFPSLDFGFVYRLYDSGLVEYFVTVYALPETAEESWLKIKFYPSQYNLGFAYKGRLYQVGNDLPDVYESNFPADGFSENWLFLQGSNYTQALIWQPNLTLKPERYYFCWELNLSELVRNGNNISSPIQFYQNVFLSPWQVRNLALGRKIPQVIYPPLNLIANKGNPFVTIPCTVEMNQILDIEPAGSFNLLSSCLNDSQPQKMPKNALGDSKCSWELQQKTNKPLELLICQVELYYTLVEKKQLIFFAEGEVCFQEKDNLLTADNGCLQITSARDSLIPCLISLQYKGTEWLENSYPDFLPRSVFNPFPGGIFIRPYRVGAEVLKLENHKADFISLKDNFENCWQGITITTTIEKFAPLKGYIYKQYYLLRPGVPVLAIFAEVVNAQGIASFHAFNFSFHRKHQQGERDGLFYIQQEDKTWQMITQTNERDDMSLDYKTLAMQISDSENYLQLFKLSKFATGWLYMDPSVAVLDTNIYTEMVTQTPARTEPIFILIADVLYQSEWLNQLRDLQFPVIFGS
ncbi:MAG TPA: GNAT family N-acetyltransferase [Candidatus Cloacimonas sp.]|nr:GNAT family N-acetyltransferase [Candidatus Cloacimonas sp.]